LFFDFGCAYFTIIMKAQKKSRYVSKELLQKQIDIVRSTSYYSTALMTLVVAISYFLFDVKEYLPVIVLPIIVGIVINMICFKFHKKLFYTFLVFFVLTLFGVFTISLVTGGISSPFIFILTVLPIGAYITSSKQGRYWIIISVIVLITLYVVSSKYEFPNIIHEEYRGGFAFFVILFTILMVTMITSMLTKSSFSAYKMKDEIQVKNEVIEEKSAQIMDSISYAKRIQDASLPSNDYLNSIFSEHLVFYRPKDIVSGDFYWAHKLKNNKTIWVAADCTGHGVPGAFMSLIGMLLLNDIVIGKKIDDPKKIAELLSEWITNLLEQKGSNETTMDGMDIMICSVDDTTYELTACGAYNSLYIIRKGQLMEFKGSKRAIGYNHVKKANEPFVSHTVQLEKGDLIYSFSDGYVDQKGGEAGKKFYSKRFKTLLEEIAPKPFLEQENILSEKMKSWKKDTEQIDDMLIFGVRVT
jgi:serine phosphatase RsbU (regulator of sigma subunit)